jgi:hypothetical protein
MTSAQVSSASRRLKLGAALSCSILLLAGCGKKTEPDRGDNRAGLERVTLHVKDMAERLDLT